MKKTSATNEATRAPLSAWQKSVYCVQIASQLEFKFPLWAKYTIAVEAPAADITRATITCKAFNNNFGIHFFISFSRPSKQCFQQVNLYLTSKRKALNPSIYICNLLVKWLYISLLCQGKQVVALALLHEVERCRLLRRARRRLCIQQPLHLQPQKTCIFINETITALKLIKHT